MTRLLKTLSNPFVLAFEGFVAGAILFWAIAPDTKPTEEAALAAKPVAAAEMLPPVEQMGSH